MSERAPESRRARATRALLCLALVVSPDPATAQDRASPIELRGSLRQGALLFGRVERGARVEIDGRPLPVTPRGELLIGLSSDAPSRVVLTVRAARGGYEERRLRVEPRRYLVQSLQVPERLVALQGDDRRRQRDGDARLDVVRRRRSARLDFAAGFRRPIQGPITAVYGSHRVLNGRPGERHFGVDFGAPRGAAVHAPAGGVVVFVGELPIQGRMIVLDHGFGLTSSLLHLERALVHVGERVEAGVEIATVGATGRVTGPHLDWRIHLDGVPLDPLTALVP